MITLFSVLIYNGYSLSQDKLLSHTFKSQTWISQPTAIETDLWQTMTSRRKSWEHHNPQHYYIIPRFLLWFVPLTLNETWFSPLRQLTSYQVITGISLNVTCCCPAHYPHDQLHSHWEINVVITSLLPQASFEIQTFVFSGLSYATLSANDLPQQLFFHFIFKAMPWVTRLWLLHSLFSVCTFTVGGFLSFSNVDLTVSNAFIYRTLMVVGETDFFFIPCSIDLRIESNFWYISLFHS